MSRAFRWNAMQKFLFALWAMFTLVLLFVVVLLIREIALNGRNPMGAFEVAEESNESPAPAASRTSSLGEREIQLYFAAADGHALAPEKRRLPFSESTVENCKTVLGALIAGPQSAEIAPILNPATTIRAAFLRPDGELVINFSRELKEGSRHSSATLETLMVQGVVQTVAQNALQNPREPQVRRVRFLIDNELPSEAFPAHIDLSEPVAPDSQWLMAQH
jgi:hypothetical protein